MPINKDQVKLARHAVENAKKICHGLTTDLIALGRNVQANSGRLKPEQVEPAKALVDNTTKNVQPLQALLRDLWKIAQELEGRAKENLLYDRLDLDRHYCMLAGAWSMWGTKVLVPALKQANPIIVASAMPSFDGALAIARSQAAPPSRPSNPSKIIIPGK